MIIYSRGKNMAKPILAIMYDFDKTLSTTDMQNYAFIPMLGMTPDEFWGATGEFSRRTGCERILSYMYMMIAKAEEKGIKLTRELLRGCGKPIKYHPGVTTWFQRINDYGASKGVKVEHYLVSSGTQEILEGCSIYDCFTKVYGCEFYYKNGVPVWPKLAINYTQKTQFFFRIAKGVKDLGDDDSVNEKRKDGLRIPYTNIAYIGDGMTDVACMTLVNKNNGYSIGVYTEDNKENVTQIRNDKRCRFIVEADYSKDTDMEKVFKLIIDDISNRYDLETKEQALAKK